MIFNLVRTVMLGLAVPLAIFSNSVSHSSGDTMPREARGVPAIRDGVWTLNVDRAIQKTAKPLLSLTDLQESAYQPVPPTTYRVTVSNHGSRV